MCIRDRTIANYLAQSCRSVIGIEYVPEAVEDAFVNRDQNGITNATFYAGDMKAILTDDFVAAHGRPDVLVTDPPRAGTVSYTHLDVYKRQAFAEVIR